MKWIGVTDKTSITYPSFSSGSGFEGINLNANKGYIWQVYGYYIPNYNLQANSIKILTVPQTANKGGIEALSSGDTVQAQTIVEVNEAQEQTASRRTYFSTSAVLFTPTTTTMTATTTTATTTTVTTTTNPYVSQ